MILCASSGEFTAMYVIGPGLPKGFIWNCIASPYIGGMTVGMAGTPDVCGGRGGGGGRKPCCGSGGNIGGKGPV